MNPVSRDRRNLEPARARMRRMPWRTRASVAAVLAISFATAPVVLDQCAASCDLAHALEAAGSTPTCHDAAGSATARIAHVPQACGHDHGATVTTLTVPRTPVTRALAPVVAVVTSQASDEWATATSFPDCLPALRKIRCHATCPFRFASRPRRRSRLPALRSVNVAGRGVSSGRGTPWTGILARAALWRCVCRLDCCSEDRCTGKTRRQRPRLHSHRQRNKTKRRRITPS